MRRPYALSDIGSLTAGVLLASTATSSVGFGLQPDAAAMTLQPRAFPSTQTAQMQQPRDAGAGASDRAAPAAAGTPGPSESLLSVRLNEELVAEAALLLRTQDQRLLVRGEDLLAWRLRLPAVEPVHHGGEDFYPLDAFRGLTYQVDEATQTVSVQAVPELFGATALKAVPVEFGNPMPPPSGAFLNYDIVGSHAAGQSYARGLLEFGTFSRWGAATTTFLGGEALTGGRKLIRLETTLTRDLPGRMASLRIGDAIGRAGQWGRSVRFGGVQWATNFATRPGFIIFPLPGLSGEAALPSTVELYVNDALRLRRDVPVGPFSIFDLPVVTGQGDARMVVRDLLGREQVIVRPFYVSPRLLRQGLHDYSYELGWIRDDFGITSNDYSRLLATGTYRIGFTDRFTGEVRGELLRSQQTAGLAGALLWPDIGVTSASLAASRAPRGSGALLALGFERQTRRLGFGAQTQLASSAFSQVGLQPDQPAPRRLSQVFASLSSRYRGSFALSYTHQDFRDRDDTRLLSAGYSLRVGKMGFLSLSVLRFLSGDRNTAFSVTFTRPLDDRTSIGASATAQSGSEQAQLQLHRSLPAGSGVGYRVVTGVGNLQRQEASITAQNDVGTYALEASRLRGDLGWRASVSGGAVLLGNSVHLSRRVTDSFAVVQVPDYAGVRVYVDNQPVARTGDDGRALLPRLRAYERNLIRIEQADLPLDALIDSVQENVVPYFRSGVLLRFPVRRSRGGLVTIMLDDGRPLPAGALAQIIGKDEQFPAGLHGQVFLTGLELDNRLRVTWRGLSCEFALRFAPTTEPLPDLGTYQCTGVAR